MGGRWGPDSGGLESRRMAEVGGHWKTEEWWGFGFQGGSCCSVCFCYSRAAVTEPVIRCTSRPRRPCGESTTRKWTKLENLTWARNWSKWHRDALAPSWLKSLVSETTQNQKWEELWAMHPPPPPPPPLMMTKEGLRQRTGSTCHAQPSTKISRGKLSVSCYNYKIYTHILLFYNVSSLHIWNSIQ